MDPSGNVTTFAGSPGMLGRVDATGAAARFNQPHGLVIDTNNNLYVADSNNHAIRKIEPSGKVTTFAGGSDVGAYADGKGSAARFFSPYGIFIDKANNIYVADTSNHRIRKIDPSANVTTFAGSSSRGYVDGPGVSAKFNSPYAVTIDTTNNIMYVADWDNARIRKITMLPTPIVTTLAGNGTKSYKDGIGTAASLQPASLALGPYNVLYVADANNNRVRGINTQTGQVVTIAGSGAAGKEDSTTLLTATFNNPRGLTTDSSNLYVTNFSGDCSIRMIKINSLTFSGGGRRRRQTRSLRKKGSRRTRR
jgi:streptogramin lyase